MTQPYTPAEIVARAIKARTTPGYWDAHHHADLLAGIATSALAAAGPDLWQYAQPDPDEPDGLMEFDGTPRVVTSRMVRRPLAPVGPWLPVPTEEDTP